ncbi:DNA-binding protein [Candidatus Kaiserbacteria bacterium]|nr:DNA-binding protein [Candidatus Kaiserbacteria bacterium]
MSDAMWLEGKEYISSKRASELSGYAQDYIGQLARKGIIAAQRVGGLWFISMASLTEYKSHAEAYVPQQPERKETHDPDSLISFDGKDHISASRAAKITGYHPDYVGQLARSGTIISRQVGNRWYIDREGILAHKQEKDGLLGAVQAQSVGISRGDASILSSEDAHGSHYNGPGPFLTYTRDDRDLIPVLNAPESSLPSSYEGFRDSQKDAQVSVPVPIRVLPKKEILYHTHPVKHVKLGSSTHGKTMYYGTFRGLAAAALTIVIVLSFGFVTLKDGSVYGTRITPSGTVIQRNMFTASAAGALEWIGHFLQNFLVKDLIYKRVE